MPKFILAAFVFLLLAGPTEARPAGCPHAWCGCWLARHLGIGGPLERRLWRAREWAVAFPRTILAPGMVAVFARGRGGGHVGKIVAVHGSSITMISGNDGRAVRTRDRSLRGLIAVVNPYSSYAVKAPVKTQQVRVAKRKITKRRAIVRHSPQVPSLYYAHAAS